MLISPHPLTKGAFELWRMEKQREESGLTNCYQAGGQEPTLREESGLANCFQTGEQEPTLTLSLNKRSVRTLGDGGVPTKDTGDRF